MFIQCVCFWHAPDLRKSRREFGYWGISGSAPGGPRMTDFDP